MARPTVGQPAWGPVLNQDITGVEAKAQDALDAASGAAASATATATRVDDLVVEVAGVRDIIAPVITPEAFGAVGDGVADDTAAVRAACEAASALIRPGLGGNIWEPGATLVLRGVYKLTSLASRLEVSANMESNGGKFIVPNAYAGQVLLVGHPAYGQSLHNADITVPTVLKVGATTLTANSVGVMVQNLQHSKFTSRRVTHFETGIWFTAYGVVGTVYNEIFPGWVDLCKVSWSLFAQEEGWVNQNVFIAGGISQSPNTLNGLPVSGRRAGWHHVILEGGTGHVIHGNTFVGCSFEGDYSQSNLLFHNAQENIFTGSTRFETGSIGEPVTFSAAFDVFTTPGNPLGLTVGQAVVVTADVAPGNITLGQIYWVNAISGGQDVTLTTTPGGGGLNVNITSDGTNARVVRPPIVHFNNADGNTFHNVIRDYNSYPGPLDIIRTGAAGPAAKAEIVG